MRNTYLMLALAASALLMTSTAAQAQSTPAELIVIQLQQRLVAERRLADDREQRLLASASAARSELQRRLAAATQSRHRSANEIRLLSTKLSAALARERALLDEILKKDPATQVVVADLQNELSQLSLGSSAAAKTAIAKFGSGDRLGAWPQIERLADSGSARDKRLAARLRSIMLGFLDPGVTARDVATRWSIATAADPSNLLAWLALASARQYLNDPRGALEALEHAGDAAHTPPERQMVAAQKSAVAATMSDPARLVRYLGEQLEATRAVDETSVSRPARKWAEQQLLYYMGSNLAVLGKTAEAADRYKESIAILEELSASDPDAIVLQEASASTLFALAILEAQMSKLEEAESHYERVARLLTARIDLAPDTATNARTMLVQTYINRCLLKEQARKFADAVALCGLAIEAQAQIPATVGRDTALAGNHYYLANLMISAGRAPLAAIELRRALNLNRRLLHDNRTPAYLFGYALALWRLASLDPSVCRSDVLEAWEQTDQLVPLNDAARGTYEAAKLAPDNAETCMRQSIDVIDDTVP